MALGPQSQPGVSPTSVLDAPPPSPAVRPLSQLGRDALGPSPLRELSPEALMGLVKSGESIGGLIDVMAQTAPQIAPDLAAAKEMVQRALGKLLVEGGGALEPSAPGPAFPGTGPMTGPGIPG